jgi:murein L,D-transpeptidase YcbB/YkuD
MSGEVFAVSAPDARRWPFVLILVLCMSAALADDVDVRDALRGEIENLRLGDSFVAGEQIAAIDVLSEFYERRRFAPAWGDADQIKELVAAIEASEADGLDPTDYLLDDVRVAQNTLASPNVIDPADMAEVDILLTESLIRLGYHERFGKVNPYTLDPNWNFRRDLDGLDPATKVQRIIDAPSLTAALRELFPRGSWYQRYRDALADYRRIQSEGGWPQIPEGKTLRPGDKDDRLEILARRLLITGDLPGDLAGPVTDYDERLREGVERFQARHALDVDGVIGPATLRALNVPVSQRVRQIEVNLERTRWITDGLEGDFILVNIAGFHAYVIRDGELVWESRVQVGRPYRRTPVFRDQMTYLVFNPTWTAPFSLATRDVLPQVQRDPDYLVTRGFDVKDRNGDNVDPTTVDWSSLTRSNFRYTFVQRPGPYNAMGQVKFMFPNRYSVYLHDTPSRGLFARSERAFSAGCIRVEKPLELAEELLRTDGWTRERIQRVLDSGELTNVFLSRPLPVFLLYWTAEIDEDGVIHFFNDVYERDEAIAEALDEPFRFELPTS